MALLLGSMAVMLAGGTLALLLRRSVAASSALGSVALGIASLGGLWAAGRALLAGTTVSLNLPWSIPYGAFSIGIDPLSAFFLLPLFFLTAVAAVFGREYLAGAVAPEKIPGHWFFLNVFAASMVLVLLARNGLLFLMGWEVMSLASFFLVTLEHEKAENQHAGWIYLIAAHAGMACLLVLFILLGQQAGSLDFHRLLVNGVPAGLTTVCFVLALLGFGIKAGFLPLHVWLPLAHPAAPSHVSALMSGIMIKLGFYGLFRTLAFLGAPPIGWGLTFIGIGLTSGILGAVMAMGQRDLKRLLAYSSVENIGIIALGIGVGLVGMSVQAPVLVLAGLGGALLHILNHALGKGLLFMGAGSVLHAARTLDLNRLGGLLRNMPWTGAAFFIGVLAVTGLPPLNGFVGEFLIYLGAFQGGLLPRVEAAVACWAAAVGLAVIGALAAAVFAKAFGLAFLGARREPGAAPAHEPGWEMRAPLVVLAAACAGVASLAPRVYAGLTPVLAQITGLPADQAGAALGRVVPVLTAITWASAVLLLTTAALLVLRRLQLARRGTASAVTWDCGYAQPTPRMQYSATSFVHLLVSHFRWLLRPKVRTSPLQGVFPDPAALRTEMPHVFYDMVFRPLFARAAWVLTQFRWVQHGRLQLYVLYIALALAAVLAWKLRS